jgi:aldehyde dehydrogenase (NAD+)
MSDVPPTAGVMQEEIFGPILPVLAFDHVEEVFTDLKNRPAPLAVYLFAQDRALVERVMRELPAGSVCVNDVMMQMLGKQLPFGGVGASGMGRYHGRASFDCFSYPKTLLHCSTRFDAPFRYPPPQLTLDKLRRVLKFLLNR